MLRKLAMENFYSIADRQELDFSVARNATDPDGRFAQPIPSSPERYPKVIALFGANASGKTNVLRPINFLVRFARESASWGPDQQLPYLPFLSQEWNHKPTFLSVELDGALLDWPQRAAFYYELQITDGRRTIAREDLSYRPAGGRRRYLFRRRKDKVDAAPDFRLPKRDPVRGKIRSNASVISTLAQFNHDFSMKLFKGLEAIQTNVGPLDKLELPPEIATNYYSKDSDALEGLARIIAKFDLGIERVTVEQTSQGQQPRFHHPGLDMPIMLETESQGTQRIYSEFPRLYYVLKVGGVAVLDELDNDIHSNLLPEIVGLFQDSKTNPHAAQLVMASHNATLLEHLVKEEVYFAEKDEAGKTHLYGLADVKGVRRDENIYAKYLAGAYGAVPRPA